MILLEWLLHLLNIPQQPVEIKEQDVGKLIRRLLLKIDAEHFRQLSNQIAFGWSQDQQFLQIFAHIAKYLIIKDFKKLSCQFQKEILANRDAQSLLGLVVYVAISSQMKQEAIESILQFDEDQQRFIMKTIQNIEAKCQQVAELKKIVEKIEEIQQENQILRERIMMNQQQQILSISQIEEFQSWNKVFTKQNSQYQEEKLAAFKQLDINDMKEFTEICLMNKQQNEVLGASLETFLIQKKAIMAQNINLKKSLKHHGQTIQRQILCIDDLKEKCKTLNQQYWLIDYKPNGQMYEIPLLPLRDNQNILNTQDRIENEKPKLSTDRTQCSNHNQELQDSFEVRNNLHVLLSLQDLERLHQEKISQIERLKQEKIQELSKQKKLDKKIKKIKECHQFFTNFYHDTNAIKI